MEVDRLQMDVDKGHKGKELTGPEISCEGQWQHRVDLQASGLHPGWTVVPVTEIENTKAEHL